MSIKECIVLGCTNKSDQGAFIKEIICEPCYKMLTTGSVVHGNTFIHQLLPTLYETGWNEALEKASSTIHKMRR